MTNCLIRCPTCRRPVPASKWRTCSLWCGFGRLLDRFLRAG